MFFAFFFFSFGLVWVFSLVGCFVVFWFCFVFWLVGFVFLFLLVSVCWLFGVFLEGVLFCFKSFDRSLEVIWDLP